MYSKIVILLVKPGNLTNDELKKHLNLLRKLNVYSPVDSALAELRVSIRETAVRR